MKDVTQILAVLAISISLITGAFAENTQTDDLSKNENEESKQFSLKDRNQNSGENNNSEENLIIHGPNFVDANGDGYNDNAPDHDNDGIPNGQDSDYVRSGKGKGQQNFIDEDGDGIADNRGQRTGKGYRGVQQYRKGLSVDSSRQGVRARNGLGFAAGARPGNCDGTGSKGKNFRTPQAR